MAAPVAVAVAIASLGACIALSARHLRLYWIGRAPGSFAVAVGFALIGAGNLVWLARAPYTSGFWLAHALDIGGVLVAAVYAGLTYRQREFSRKVIAPVLVHDPASALELGLDPIVHRFVADLEQKDPVTRDHVVRTSELALELGSHLAVPATQLGALGLAALLHDVGKLEVPAAILLKPGRLTPEEFQEMQRHPIIGERLVLESRVLADIAPIVRAHHERVDGHGYPDGLAGDSIPLLARIVSVCDGFDAMACDRRYRSGMGEEQAGAILREHAGTQWDSQVVSALMDMRRLRPESSTPTVLATVGRDPAAARACVDALPPVLQDS
jgi:HD-GYP domain-containing protein (c-di-GMP phosphodiesterase class II)